MEDLIASYGYLAVLIGTVVEGENVLVLGGIAAHKGYLMLPWVIVTAFLGSLIGDQLFFFLGRRHGGAILDRFPRWGRRAQRARQLLDRYHIPLIFGLRFMYGIRTAGLIVVGMSNVSTGRFLVINAMAALTWACLVGSAGFFLGTAVELLLDNIKDAERNVLIGVAALAVGAWLLHRLRWVLRKSA